MKEKPYIETKRIIIDRKYNSKYGDDKECKCGHPYYRHFDTYEDMYACGCKYCDCLIFEMKIEVNYIVTTSGWYGKQTFECETESDVLEAMGQDWSYEVESPAGKSIDQFIPF